MARGKHRMGRRVERNLIRGRGKVRVRVEARGRGEGRGENSGRVRAGVG